MPKKKTVIVVMGRGIGKDLETGKFVPTGMWERMDFSSGRAAHTGIIEEANPDNEDVRYGGGTLNDRAGANLYWEMVESGDSPEAIYVAAGYPPYLQKMMAEVSEGVVHIEWIKKELEKIGGRTGEEKLVNTYPTNQDTFDDLSRSIQNAVRNGINKAIFITVEVHIPRVKTIGKEVKKTLEIADLEMEFIASEDILRKNNSEFERIYDEAKTKKAYKLTVEQEEKGTKDFLEGRYKFIPRLV